MVARTTGYSPCWIPTLACRYRDGGTDALGDRRYGNPGGANRALLTLTQEPRETLRDALGGPAPDGGLWTGPKVARWMSERLDRPVSVQRGWEAFRTLGFRLQQPRPRSTRADPVAQEAAKKGRYVWGFVRP